MFGFGKKKKEEVKVEEQEEEVIKDGFMPVYNVKLLYTEEPKLNLENILARLKKSCGEIDVITADNNGDMMAVAFREHVVTYKDDKKVPSQGVILKAKFEYDVDKLQGALQQSWMFRDVEETVIKARHQLVITDMMAAGLEYKERLSLFQNLVIAVLEETDCIAVNWDPSEQFVHKEDYLKNVAEDCLYAAVNVRFYNVSDGDEGDMLMDTLGLSALGIPDLQCHFRNLDPNAVSNMLYNTAHYLYEKGDIIEDGHTVQGLKPEDKWLCQHEVALAGPERIVIDINPGKGFASGNRN
ncbi:DUF4261 domain-containing protein [Inconstantimicrobium mannanitabidum]|uniref:Uncharacterized protein n=1 Tax=Inconstantimicrobium mannanitabidum TaxID=1604901 RepID=A0ACB5RGG3_9CLOT|nr:DUF4261 domain-containing protein [Clostridium sp. TW13]GKX68139.1 hypothetical protein rsdtw13_33970 [Clostridium sp. TW13]